MLRNISLKGRSPFIKTQNLQGFGTKPARSAVKQLEQIHIDEAIKLEPSLSIYANDIWYRTHDTFQNHGLQTINFLRIVTSNPKLLQRSSESIIDSLETWRACQFGERLLHLLLTKYPELLDVIEPNHLLYHIGYLKSRVSTSKNVWKVLMNSPDVLSQPESRLEEKLNYILKDMRIEVPELVKSAALSLSFEDLCFRHVFQLRLGLFRPRSLKAVPGQKNTNNRLYQITDTSEKSFATKICHVTLPEYEAFKELFTREKQRRQLNPETEDQLSDEED